MAVAKPTWCKTYKQTNLFFLNPDRSFSFMKNLVLELSAIIIVYTLRGNCTL